MTLDLTELDTLNMPPLRPDASLKDGILGTVLLGNRSFLGVFQANSPCFPTRMATDWETAGQVRKHSSQKGS